MKTLEELGYMKTKDTLNECVYSDGNDIEISICKNDKTAFKSFVWNEVEAFTIDELRAVLSILEDSK